MALVSQQPIETVKPREKKRGCFSYVMGVFLLGVVVMVWALWTVASTGLVRVPLFSVVAFRSPEPTRVVEPDSEDLGQWFQSALVSESLRQARLGVIHRNVTLVVPETLLTGALQTFGSSKEAADVPFDFTSAQVAIIDEHLEVFLPVLGTDTAVIASFTPTFQEGHLAFQVEALRVGTFRVPRFVVRSLVNQAVQIGSDQVASGLESVMTLKDLSVTSDGLAIQGELAPGVLPL